jgi:ATP-dependent helicase HepA
LGDELIDAVADYVKWDDRGQSFAIWREDTTWSAAVGSEWAGFRFDFIIETEMGEANAVLKEHGAVATSEEALMRRGDGYLPPRTASIFVDIGLTEVTDSALLRILRRRFCKHRTASGQDYNLTKHRVKLLDSIVSSDEWEALCRNAREAALQFVRQRPKVREHNTAHAEAARRAIQLKDEQLQLRMARLSDADRTSTFKEAELERELGAALVRGITNPRVRVDAIGFIVVSGRNPFMTLEGRPLVFDHA